MASRSLLATVCLLLLLLLTLLGSTLVEARPAPRSPHRNAPRRHLWTTNAPEGSADGYPNTWYAHRKLGEESKPPKNATTKGVQFDVGSFGATGDGQTDDTGAFQNAWAQACSSEQPAVLLVPAGKSYLVKETSLSGPCKSKVTFKLEGTLVAPEDKSGWSKQGHPHWVSFSNVDSLTVTGKGAMDGKGKTSWKNSCRRNHKMPCTFAPAALTFSSCNHLKVENIKLLNAPQIHLWVEFCSDVTLSRLTIASPGNSPENDGIHVAHSDGVRILGAKIKAGDDCISIAMGTTNLYATKIECGPGHGISVGSLGKGSTRAEVSNVTIDGAHVSGTLFGARIKTWQGGTGYARDIKFLNMVMDKVKNPIVIDQNYCTTSDPSKPKACSQKESAAVEISNVEFSNIRGTSVNRDAIRLHCSEAFPCRGVVLRDIELKTRGGDEKNAATSTCENAVLGETSNVSPAPCSSAATKEDLVPLGSEEDV
ncbi:polygalacturonase ADPG2 [Setaria viridis]|nr:polygalacturonase ADPG1-like [Setaria viridis]